MKEEEIISFLDYLTSMTYSQLKQELKKANLPEWQSDAIKQQIEFIDEAKKMEIVEVYLKKTDKGQ